MLDSLILPFKIFIVHLEDLIIFVCLALITVIVIALLFHSIQIVRDSADPAMQFAINVLEAALIVLHVIILRIEY